MHRVEWAGPGRGGEYLGVREPLLLFRCLARCQIS